MSAINGLNRSGVSALFGAPRTERGGVPGRRGPRYRIERGLKAIAGERDATKGRRSRLTETCRRENCRGRRERGQAPTAGH